jgi:hypothetical protein
MIDNELTRKWIEELRSDRWVQGRNELRRECEGAPTRFCCLGVLCEIVQPGALEDVCGEGKDTLVRAQIAVEAANFEFTHLILLNDSRKASFHEIAYEIERMAKL